MQSSKYAQQVPAILAQMEQARQEDETQHQPAEQGMIHVYRLEGGGIVMTDTPIEDEVQPPPTVDAEPETDHRPTRSGQIPYFLQFLLLLFLFLALDNVDTVLAQLAPTVNVTITPVVKTITTTATVSVGDRADIVME